MEPFDTEFLLLDIPKRKEFLSNWVKAQAEEKMAKFSIPMKEVLEYIKSYVGNRRILRSKVASLTKPFSKGEKKELGWVLYWLYNEGILHHEAMSFTYKLPCSYCGNLTPVINEIWSRPISESDVTDTSFGCDDCFKAGIPQRKVANKLIEGRHKKLSPERLEYLKTMPYHEYLETEEWKFIRKMMYWRLGNSCEVCGQAKEEMAVHHKTYERRGHEDANDLMVVCSDCHRKIHHIEVAEF